VNPRELLIVGPPRSGTTLLTHVLGGGDGVLCVSEPFLCRAIMLPWQLNRFFYRFQASAGLARRRPPLRGNVEQFARFLRQIARENGFRHLVIKETYRRSGLKPIWHNESLLDGFVGRATAVTALLRHPYDVAASTVGLCRWVTGVRGRLFRIRLPNLPAFRDGTEVVRWAAENWACYVGWVRHRGLSVTRYEDIVADPRRQLRSVCRACQLEFAESMLDARQPRVALGGLGDVGVLMKPRPVDKRSVGRGRQLTGAQQRIVRDACEHLARDFEYTC
jgi:hypothetical protein